MEFVNLLALCSVIRCLRQQDTIAYRLLSQAGVSYEDVEAQKDCKL